MDGPRHIPTGGGPPELRRRIMWTLGSALRAWRTLADAKTLAERCHLTQRRARGLLREQFHRHLPHHQARTVVAEADRLLGLDHPYDGPPDWAALVAALQALGYTRHEIASHIQVQNAALRQWATRDYTPGWLGGELLLHAWADATAGTWTPAHPPAGPVPCATFPVPAP